MMMMRKEKKNIDEKSPETLIPDASAIQIGGNFIGRRRRKILIPLQINVTFSAALNKKILQITPKNNCREMGIICFKEILFSLRFKHRHRSEFHQKK
jgi:hypothetical protein